MRAATITIVTGLAALLGGGCDPVTMGVTAGASLAANALFGDSKMTQVAREAYVRAPICSARPNGIPNGRIVLLVRNIGWYSFYPMPDGRSVAAESGKSLVVIEYEIANPGDRDVMVNTAAPASPMFVLGDRDELIRVFENLVENALKYAASGKRVDVGFSSITASDGSPEVLIAVRDYGPGIAAEHLPRLTERFYRVDVTQSRAEGGTGLGLALVKHILNRHRGKLSIESEAGKGAIFTVRLPLVHTPSIERS